MRHEATITSLLATAAIKESLAKHHKILDSEIATLKAIIGELGAEMIAGVERYDPDSLADAIQRVHSLLELVAERQEDQIAEGDAWTFTIQRDDNGLMKGFEAVQQ